MSTWRVDLRISPYHGVTRGPCPHYLTDPRDRQRGAEAASVEIQADDYRAAFNAAQAIVAGVMLDERVWQARIVGIAEVRP